MSKRIQRVNQLIKEEISKILLKEVDFPKNTLVTVTRVDTSPDLRETKVFVSSIPESQSRKSLSVLKKNCSLLQRKIGQALLMKIIPKIKFIEEEKTKEAARIEEILEKLKEGKK